MWVPPAPKSDVRVKALKGLLAALEGEFAIGGVNVSSVAGSAVQGVAQAAVGKGADAQGEDCEDSRHDIHFCDCLFFQLPWFIIGFRRCVHKYLTFSTFFTVTTQ